jgi:hypothetical protein
MVSVPAVREIDARLCAAGGPFALEMLDVGPRPVRTWANGPHTLPNLLAHGTAAGGGRDFLVFDDEHLSHEEHAARVASFAAALVDLGVGSYTSSRDRG